jgi:hypothetical protein
LKRSQSVAASARSPAAPGREDGGAERDLDGVLAGDAELARPEPLAQPRRHLRLGEITQRVHHLLLRDRREHPRVPVAERRDAEAARQVEVLATVGVDDAAALGLGPDHAAVRLPGTNRPIVSAAM